MNINYCKDFLEPEVLQKVGQDACNLDWCIPPAGIPGNHPPRNVAVLGCPDTTTHVYYPLFQTAKSCYAKYSMKPFTDNLNSLVLLLRNKVKELYGSNATNIERMFNVAVCNYYTEDRHQIAAHRDDERWLERNMSDSSSLIASFTYYVDEVPSKLRNFEIFDNSASKWTSYNLEHNSIIFFSNHLHRAKPIGKRSPSCRRINITFRTLAPGLLGLTGYGNFHRYMSLPIEIGIFKSDKLETQIKQFSKCAENSNKFLGKQRFITDIPVKYFDKEERSKLKKSMNKVIDLPRYIKPLCSLENIYHYSK